MKKARVHCGVSRYIDRVESNVELRAVSVDRLHPNCHGRCENHSGTDGGILSDHRKPVAAVHLITAELGKIVFLYKYLNNGKSDAKNLNQIFIFVLATYSCFKSMIYSVIFTNGRVGKKPTSILKMKKICIFI